MRGWLDTVPNDGLLRYYITGSSERLTVTSLKALSEVLVLRAYDFAKTELVRNSLGRITGIGVLLAEGDEHKVHIYMCPFCELFIRADIYTRYNGKISNPHSRFVI